MLITSIIGLTSKDELMMGLFSKMQYPRHWQEYDEEIQD
jgi:hypothetical protein